MEGSFQVWLGLVLGFVVDIFILPLICYSFNFQSIGIPFFCQHGFILSTESAVPGAYQQSCMDLDERSFVLKASGDTITVYQGTKSAGGMAGRTGGEISFMCYMMFEYSFDKCIHN